MDIGSLTVDEIKNGCRFDAGANAWLCNHCGKSFPKGQVFPAGGVFFDAENACARHVEDGHGGNAGRLIFSDTKYNTLTANQKELLSLFGARVPDAEIAKRLGVTASTVRRQKFAFREKAKQARLYLAIFERVFGGNGSDAGKDDLVPIHDQAVYYDDRYVITEEEKEAVLRACFASLDPP
ncbi:MAG: transcriptional regulator, partial [Firmicutes bacterium]|nr:transcriptional regulator [Bacillota bacterium]